MASPQGLPLLPLTDSDLEQYYGDAPRGVRANMVQTLDGAGAFAGRTKRITDPADQTLLKHLRSQADVVLVGAATVQAEKYGPVRLTDAQRDARQANGYAAAPPLAIVTARAMLSLDLRVFDPEAPRPLIFTLAAAAADHPELSAVADVVPLGAEIDLAQVLAELAERGLGRILCEGGPFVLSQLIEQDLVEEMCLTLSPYLAGSQPTKPQPASLRELPTRLELRHVLTRNDLLYLRYSRPIT
jgi:riboflavin biosynthesis pyrimidine reductase